MTGRARDSVKGQAQDTGSPIEHYCARHAAECFPRLGGPTYLAQHRIMAEATRIQGRGHGTGMKAPIKPIAMVVPSEEGYEDESM